MLKINTIYHGDCLEVMKQIDDKSIDMILCDLPYGMTALGWDKNIDVISLWVQYNRIIKNNGTIALFSTQPFTTKIIISNEDDFRYCWYWVKNQATNFFHAKQMPLRKVEEICIFKRGKYYPQMTEGHTPTNSAMGCSKGKVYYGTNKRRYNGGDTTRYPTNVLEYKCVNNYKKFHSLEKPIDLLEFLIKSYTDEGDLILDNCAGSGTTAIASLNTNRNFILIEKELNYCEIAAKRINEHQNAR